jgi:hypothetical protein
MFWREGGSTMTDAAADTPPLQPGNRLPGERARPTVPPVLYLPTSGTASGPDQVGIELRDTNDRRRALLAYTALDRLVDCCGPHQPWALYPTERLGELGVEYDVIYLDMPIPQELWHVRGAP